MDVFIYGSANYHLTATDVQLLDSLRKSLRWKEVVYNPSTSLGLMVYGWALANKQHGKEWTRYLSQRFKSGGRPDLFKFFGGHTKKENL